jgi:hypothetical protein
MLKKSFIDNLIILIELYGEFKQDDGAGTRKGISSKHILGLIRKKLEDYVDE